MRRPECGMRNSGGVRAPPWGLAQSEVHSLPIECLACTRTENRHSRERVHETAAARVITFRLREHI